jgi:TetR/AcrR family transcriptional regulator, transcriptional repressor for nem operon
MGRSSQEQALRNRAKIVEKASGLFRNYGVDNVSVADVMGAVGMTIGGFYKHFESKGDLIQEAFSLAFRQASASWHRVSEREYDGEAEHAAAIVNYYLQKKPPEQACPIIAFAPHIAGDTSDGLSADAYREGTEELFKQFVDHMKSHARDGSDPAADRDAQVLFAAMVGARFLAEALGDAEWTRSVQVAVRRRAAEAAPCFFSEASCMD